MNPDQRTRDRESVVREYSRLAEVYDEKWPFYVEVTTRETARRMNPGPTDRLLDVGCGTGALLHHLAGTHPDMRLSGVDPVPDMLKIARGRLPARVDLHEGWAENLPFEQGQFDVVASCNMFHYIREPVAALQEMRRVLRPGGQLVITDWCDDYLACRLCDVFLRVFNSAHFKTYRTEECVRLLNEAGQVDVHVDRYKISWLWGLMTASSIKETT